MSHLQPDDWRLMFYDPALDGATFRLQTFCTEGRWDHEHCLCCWQKITDHPLDTDADREGYVCVSIPNRHDWMCKECFEDFREDRHLNTESEEIT